MKGQFNIFPYMLYLPFFYFVSIFSGGFTALFVSFCVHPSWPMLCGMFTGMFIGLVVLTIVFFLFSNIAGPFEIVMTNMFIVKIVGMVTGMWIPMGNPSKLSILIFGVLTGIIIQGIFHFYDKSLHGEVL